MRLEKSLDDVEGLSQHGGCMDLQYNWDRYPGVLRSRENDRKSLLCTRKEFLQRTYYCQHTFPAGDSSSEGDGDDDDDDDDDNVTLFWSKVGSTFVLFICLS